MGMEMPVISVNRGDKKRKIRKMKVQGGEALGVYDPPPQKKMQTRSDPLFDGVPPSQDGRDVDEDEGEADEQHLQVARHGAVDAVVVTAKKSGKVFKNMLIYYVVSSV
jgi:hypothetical protein